MKYLEDPEDEDNGTPNTTHQNITVWEDSN